jgi:hypothetical protein
MLRSLRSKEGFAWEETVGLSNWLCAQHRGDATYLGSSSLFLFCRRMP